MSAHTSDPAPSDREAPSEHPTPPAGVWEMSAQEALPYIGERLRQIGEEQQRLHAGLAGTANAAGRAEHKVDALAGQVAELRSYTQDRALAFAGGLEELDKRVARRFARAEDRERKREQQRHADTESLRVSIMGVQLAVAKDETERTQWVARLAAAEAKADEAKRVAAEAAEEAEEAITGQYAVVRQPSQNDEFVLGLARDVAAVKLEERRADIEVKTKQAKTDIELRAETRRALIKACSIGGVVGVVIVLIVQAAIKYFVGG